MIDINSLSDSSKESYLKNRIAFIENVVGDEVTLFIDGQSYILYLAKPEPLVGSHEEETE